MARMAYAGKMGDAFKHLVKTCWEDSYAHAWMGLGSREVSFAHGYGFHNMH
jgi:hypothetical protein